MLVHWIWLATRPGLNDRDKVALLRHFRDPEELFFAEKEACLAVEGLSEDALDGLTDKDLQPAKQILAQCRNENIHICTFHDAAYPARLKNISDPPVLLYYKGCLPDFDGTPVIAVVGTRKPSAYGITAAKRMGYQIARCGGIVVSGLAYGIDGVAMSGGLTAGGSVVGVLGCGADVVYPLSNRSLFRDTEQCGCLLTEFPPGTPPMRWNFPKRNRIISGLSCGVLVVEAPEKSGALITARQAADQGRDVFVVPGNIDVDTSVGSNSLLRDGAIAVQSGWDVMSEYQAQYPDKVRKYTAAVSLTVYAEEAPPEKEQLKVAQKPASPAKNRSAPRKKDKKPIDNGETGAYSDVVDPLQGLSEEERNIAGLLLDGERLVDDVIAAARMPAGKVLGILTMLEIKGVAKRLPGKRICLKSKP